jgi:hypothetical protein
MIRAVRDVVHGGRVAATSQTALGKVCQPVTRRTGWYPPNQGRDKCTHSDYRGERKEGSCLVSSDRQNWVFQASGETLGDCPWAGDDSIGR